MDTDNSEANQSKAADCEHQEITIMRSRQIRADRMPNPPIQKHVCALKGQVLGNGCDYVGRELDCPIFEERE